MHDIEASQAICDAATPGPLVIYRNAVYTKAEDLPFGDSEVVTAGRWYPDQRQKDLTFIAHARTALPAANRELAEARKVMKQMAEALEPFAAEYKVASEAGEGDDNISTALIDAAWALEACRKYLEQHNADEH